MERIGLRAAGRLAGCDHAHISRLASAGRLPRGEDGLFDPADVVKVMAQADPGLIRKSPPKGGDRVVTKPVKPPVRPQSPRRRVTTPSAPLPQADVAGLWDIVSELPALAAWIVVFKDAGIQTAFDLATDLMLDIAGDLAIRGFAPPPIAFETTDWTALAKEAGLDPIDPAVLLAAWQGDRDAG